MEDTVCLESSIAWCVLLFTAALACGQPLRFSGPLLFFFIHDKPGLMCRIDMTDNLKRSFNKNELIFSSYFLEKMSCRTIFFSLNGYLVT